MKKEEGSRRWRSKRKKDQEIKGEEGRRIKKMEIKKKVTHTQKKKKT
jgi:hypothetical protein